MRTIQIIFSLLFIYKANIICSQPDTTISVKSGKPIELIIYKNNLKINHSDSIKSSVNLELLDDKPRLDNPLLNDKNINDDSVVILLEPYKSDRFEIANESFYERMSLFISYTDNWWYSNPGTAYSGVLPSYANISAGIGYEFIMDHSLIVQFASDQLPHYRIEEIDGNVVETPYQTIESFYLGYRHDARWSEIVSGLWPYASISIGQSQYGPSGRSSFGLSYTPETKITLDAAYELVGFSLTNNGNNNLLYKSGPLFTISYNL